jgi:hypothetical protein
MITSVKLFKYFVFITLFLSSIFSTNYIIGFIYNLYAIFLFTLVFFIVFLTGYHVRRSRPRNFIPMKDRFGIGYFFISVSLSFFILSLFFPPARNSWDSFVNNDEAYRYLLDAAFYYSIILIPALGSVLLFWRLFGKVKSFGTSVIVLLLFLLLWIAVINLVASEGLGVGKVLSEALTIGIRNHDFIVTAIIPVIKVIVGSLPLGWFYELFVGTVMPKKVTNNSFS